MHIEAFREYCLQKKGVTESFPFGGDTLVFKVMDKMFALTSLDNYLSINLKCNPEKAVQLREQYSFVLPGYHMNKKHWNTIMLEEGVNNKLLREWIDESYQLVVESLPKKLREALV
jgi:predicted DNA-binding protein (MmcQ/YjbR family)